MTMRTVAAFIVVATTLHVPATADQSPAPAPLFQANGQRHHYKMSARIRPLLFWIGRDDVGDAIVVKRQDSDGVSLSLLIGSDPEKAPRQINRWGYIDEEIHGDAATLIGLMSESDEESVGQAEANIRKQGGQRVFKVIRGSIADGEARSVVTSVAAPADYTFRHAPTVLDLANGESPDSGTRVVRLPPGTRPGFLVTLADMIHAQVDQWQTSRQVTAGDPLHFVYHGRLYELRVTRTRAVSDARVGRRTYGHALTSQFQIKNLGDGELTDFSMTYAADGPLTETPLGITFRPRWWLEVRLTLDDDAPGQPPAR